MSDAVVLFKPSCREANSADGGTSCVKSAKRFSRLSLRLTPSAEEGSSEEASFEASSMLTKLGRFGEMWINGGKGGAMRMNVSY